MIVTLFYKRLGSGRLASTVGSFKAVIGSRPKICEMGNDSGERASQQALG